MTINRTVFLRGRTVEKTKSCLFRLRRGQFVSAKRADIEARRRAAYQQSHHFPPYSCFSADGAARAATDRVITEETCPLAQPLVKSLHAISLLRRECCGSRTKKASDEF